MTKRVCQSCHHFRAAGFDNMGWCNHPKRRIGTDVKIFVRAQELPCRNDWDHDLWEARSAAPADVVVDAGVTPVPPASPAELGSLAALERRSAEQAALAGSAAGHGEDIVVGGVTTLSTADTSTDEQRREVLRRAHEELRVRKREQRPSRAPVGISPFPGDSEATGIPPSWRRPQAHGVHSDKAGRHVGSRLAEPSAAALGELGRPFAQLSSMPSGDTRFSSIPERNERFDLPLAAPARPVPDAAAPESSNEPVSDLASWSGQHTDDLLDPEPAWIEPIRDDGIPRRPRRGPLVARHRERAFQARALVDSPAFDPEAIDLGDEALDWQRDATAAPVHDAPDAMNPSQRPLPDPRDGRANDRTGAGRDEEIDILLGVKDDEPDPVPELWLHVPRMCRTCRDFRPAENGDRGWCTNKWAFNHRRMVDADELPCETSVGGWWLPHDDVWLAAADVSAHSQPTPLLDQWLAARAAAHGEAEPAPLIRRRQR